MVVKQPVSLKNGRAEGGSRWMVNMSYGGGAVGRAMGRMTV